MAETEDLLKLGNSITVFTSGQTNNRKPAKGSPLDQMQQMQGIVKELVGAEEVVYTADTYALVGNIYDENLYQSSRRDLIGTDLRCFAQVKRVFESGAPLLRNTIFAKLNDQKSKEELISAFRQLAKDSSYQFEADVAFEIKDKPVYELELIALYLESSQPNTK